MKDWIDELSDQKIKEDGAFESNANATIAAGFKAQAEIPNFIRQLSLELSSACQKLTTTGSLNMNASFSDNSDSQETRWRVQVTKLGLIPDMRYVDVLHRKDAAIVRCHSLQGSTANLRFGAKDLNQHVGLYSETDGIVMDAVTVAREILKPMVDKMNQK